VLLAERIVAALVRKLGAAVTSGLAVRAVDPDRGQVTLASGASLAADQVVVAAGPWVARLLPRMGARVTPSRQVVVYADPPAPLLAAWRAMPVVIDLDQTSGFYLIPPVAGFPLKLGDHRFSLTGDPDRDRGATAADTAAILAVCRERLCAFDRFTIGEARTCFYDVEPKERFIVEPVGKRGWVMSGFSGHGFKFGALLGETLAAAIGGERDPAAVARYAAGLGGP
jgi:glycine/D-amino acid oxidase-like deaminating enzyme